MNIHEADLEITGYTPGVGTIDYRHEHKGTAICISRAGIWRTFEPGRYDSTQEARIAFCCPHCGVDLVELEARFGAKVLQRSFPKLIGWERRLGALSEKLGGE